MKPVDRRKFFAAIRRAAAARGIDVNEDADAGSGSHGSLVFRIDPDCRPLRLVIVYAREISPGVQRAMMAHVRRRAETAARGSSEQRLAAAVVQALEECVGRQTD